MLRVKVARTREPPRVGVERDRGSRLGSVTGSAEVGHRHVGGVEPAAGRHHDERPAGCGRGGLPGGRVGEACGGHRDAMQEDPPAAGVDRGRLGQGRAAGEPHGADVAPDIEDDPRGEDDSGREHGGTAVDREPRPGEVSAHRRERQRADAPRRAPGQAALGDQVEGVVADDHHPCGSATGHPGGPHALAGRGELGRPSRRGGRRSGLPLRLGSARLGRPLRCAALPGAVRAARRGRRGTGRGRRWCRGGRRQRPPAHDERSGDHQRTQCTVRLHSGASPAPVPVRRQDRCLLASPEKRYAVIGEPAHRSAPARPCRASPTQLYVGRAGRRPPSLVGDAGRRLRRRATDHPRPLR